MRAHHTPATKDLLSLATVKNDLADKMQAFPSYDAIEIIKKLLCRSFALSQIQLLDDVIRPYLISQKSRILRGERKIMSKEMAALISKEQYLEDFSIFDFGTSNCSKYYKQMTYLTPSIACRYAADIQAQLLDIAEHHACLIDELIKTQGIQLGEYTDFNSALQLLTFLAQVDAQYHKACLDLEMKPMATHTLTLKMARVCMTTIKSESQLAAITALLPAEHRDVFTQHVRATWPNKAESTYTQTSALMGLFPLSRLSQEDTEEAARRLEFN